MTYTLGGSLTFRLAHSWRKITCLPNFTFTALLAVYSVKQNVFDVHSAELLCTSSPKRQIGPYRTMYWKHFVRHRDRKCLNCLSNSHLKVSVACTTSKGVLANPRLKKALSQLIRDSILILWNSYYAGSPTLRKTLTGIPTYGSHIWVLLRSSGSESLSSTTVIPIILDYYSYSRIISA